MTSNNRVILVGHGAQAKYAQEICKLRGYFIVAHLDPDSLGALKDHESQQHEVSVFVAAADPREKQQLCEYILNMDFHLATLTHPSAVVATTAQIGEGVLINANVTIQPYAYIGRGVMIHAGVIVEHDCLVSDYANLAPNVVLAGWVRVGRRARIYTGASVIPKVRISHDAVVGAGAAVIEDVAAATTVAGVPARVKKWAR